MKTKRNRSFWDSSALVPLFCRDSDSARSRELLRTFPEIVVWWNTPVEIHSAFIRLLKARTISQEGMTRALGFLNEFRLRWREVLPIEDVHNLAEECLDRYRIRSPDAFQLAAAITWCNGNPKGRPFVCFDQELCDAARQAGFEMHL